MDITNLMQFGFSVVICLLMWKHIDETEKTTQTVLKDMTVAIQKLTDKLDSHLANDKKDGTTDDV